MEDEILHCVQNDKVREGLTYPTLPLPFLMACEASGTLLSYPELILEMY